MRRFCVFGSGSEMVSLNLGWIQFHPTLVDTMADPANCASFKANTNRKDDFAKFDKHSIGGF